MHTPSQDAVKCRYLSKRLPPNLECYLYSVIRSGWCFCMINIRLDLYPVLSWNWLGGHRREIHLNQYLISRVITYIYRYLPTSYPWALTSSLNESIWVAVLMRAQFASLLWRIVNSSQTTEYYSVRVRYALGQFLLQFYVSTCVMCVERSTFVLMFQQ